MRTRSRNVSSSIESSTISKKSGPKTPFTASPLKDLANVRQLRSMPKRDRNSGVLSKTGKSRQKIGSENVESSKQEIVKEAVEDNEPIENGPTVQPKPNAKKKDSNSNKKHAMGQENHEQTPDFGDSETSDDEVLSKKVKPKETKINVETSAKAAGKSEAPAEKQTESAPRKRKSNDALSKKKSKHNRVSDSLFESESDSEWFDEKEPTEKPNTPSVAAVTTRAPRKSKVKAKDDIRQSVTAKEPLDDDEVIPTKPSSKPNNNYNDLDWDSESDVPLKKKKQPVKKKASSTQSKPEPSKPKAPKLTSTKSTKTQKKPTATQNLSDSDSDDWEEVPGVDRFKQSLGLSVGANGEDHQGVTVVLEKDKDEAFRNYVAQMIRKAIRRKQISIHKAFLVCFCAAGRYRNSICNSELLQAMMLSLIPTPHTNKPRKAWNVESIKVFETWFSSAFKISENIFGRNQVTVETLQRCIKKHKCQFYSEYVMLFVIALRSLGFLCRFVWTCYPPVIKAKTELTESEKKLTEKVLEQREIDEANLKKKAEEEKLAQEIEKQESATKEVEPVDIGNKDETISSDEEMVDSGPVIVTHKLDDIKALLMQTEQIEDTSKVSHSNTVNEKTSSYFKTSSLTTENKEVVDKNPKPGSEKQRKSGKQKKGKAEVKEASSDTETDLSPDVGTNCWVEVYLKKEDCWIPVSPVDKIFNKPYAIEKQTVKTISYVFVFDNYNCVKDVTKRYSAKWGSVNQKLRVDWMDKERGKKWLKSFGAIFKPLDATFDAKEDIQIADQMCNMPIPGTVAELKDHPLYVLERHLLKFEVLHPKTAPILGYVRNEPVFARKNVKLCHTEQTWLKEGMSVKQGEYPVKYVKPLISTHKLKKLEGQEIPMAGLFGEWQVELFKSPPVVDGRIPRNEYDNVNLFKMHMLPPGSVYLDLPGLDKIAKSLDVDCVPAMRGWDFSGFRARPILEGFVVCAENEQLLRDCWTEKLREAEAKNREFRAVTNWTRLVKALKIRQIIKRKYEYSEKKACGEQTLAKDDDDFEVI